MRFTKQNARYYGRKGGRTAAQNRTSKARQAEAERQAQAEAAAFSRFEQAGSGYFNGFEMANIFHARINKADALTVEQSDDSGNAHGVHVGADGVTVYFFCKPEQARKQVAFSRSVYVF